MQHFLVYLFAAVMSLFGVHNAPTAQLPANTSIGQNVTQSQSTNPPPGAATPSPFRQDAQATNSSLLPADETVSRMNKKDIRTLYIWVSSKNHNTALLIKEPNGEEVGFDPQIQAHTFKQSPNVACFEDGYYANVEGGEPDNEGIEDCSITTPLLGNYVISVMGKSGGPYSYELGMEEYYEDGTSDAKTITGTSTTGSTDSYFFDVGKK